MPTSVSGILGKCLCEPSTHWRWYWHLKNIHIYWHKYNKCGNDAETQQCQKCPCRIIYRLGLKKVCLGLLFAIQCGVTQTYPIASTTTILPALCIVLIMRGGFIKFELVVTSESVNGHYQCVSLYQVHLQHDILYSAITANEDRGPYLRVMKTTFSATMECL